MRAEVAGLALQQGFETVGLCRVSGDDPGAFLHVVEAGHRVIEMQHGIGTDRSEIRNPRLRFEAAAEFVADVAGKPALEGRKPSDMRLRVFRQQVRDELKRWLHLALAIEDRDTLLNPQRVARIAGEEGIAAEVLLAHHAFEQRQVALALEPQRQAGGLQVENLAGLRLPHGRGI